MNKHTYNLFKNVFNDFLTECKGGKYGLTLILQKCLLKLSQLKGERVRDVFINSTTVFNHQTM